MSAEVAGYFALQSPVFIPGLVASAVTKLGPSQSLGWGAQGYLSWLSPVQGHRCCQAHHVEGDSVIVAGLWERRSLRKGEAVS